MDFTELSKLRQSCRKYNPEKAVDEEKISTILEAANLAPSACNSQPYNVTVAKGIKAKEVAKATTGMGMNSFTADAPVMLIIAEGSYSRTAAMGAKVKGNDYRSIDIGILSAFITLKAAELGLGTCILGWFDDKKVRSICNIYTPVRLIITLGYPEDNYPIRDKKRKNISDYVSFIE
ncbi:MAG: nitroreductase family protein [Clostridia bacterium]|nr:nitroreductase family protein [Clostridia bacterium]